MSGFDPLFYAVATPDQQRTRALTQPHGTPQYLVNNPIENGENLKSLSHKKRLPDMDNNMHMNNNQYMEDYDEDSTNDSNVSLDLEQEEMEELSEVELMSPSNPHIQQQRAFQNYNPNIQNNMQSMPPNNTRPNTGYYEKQVPQLHINARKTGLNSRFEVNTQSSASTDSPSGNIVTPTSPSRVPFQSISTVSTLTQSLEEAAMSSQPNTRMALWKEWAAMIRESENANGQTQTYMDDNYQLMSFKEAFLKSQALELVAESVIRDPEVRDDSLWDLFNQCLIGDENDHLQLITCLKQIGEALHNYSELVMQQEKPEDAPSPRIDLGELITEISIKIMTQFKIKPEQQRLLKTSLNNIEKQIVEKEKQLASKNKSKVTSKTLNFKAAISGELVRLCEQKRDILTNMSQKWDSPEVANEIFNSCIQQVDRAIRGRGWDEEEAYDDEEEENPGRYETAFDSHVSNTGSVNTGSNTSFTGLGDIQQQLKQIEEEKAATTEKFTIKIRAFDENLVRINDNYTTLMERKKKLEEELKNVNLSLSKLSEDQEAIQKEKDAHQVQVNHTLEVLDSKAMELREMALYQNAEPVLSILQDFIDKTRNILVDNLKKRSDGLEQMIQKATSRYIEQVASYLEQQNQRMLEILKNKILVLCEKLNSLRKRYSEYMNQGKEREAQEKLKKIKFYYHRYVTSEKSAKDILLDAENINQFIHNLPYAMNFTVYVHQIDNQLTVLSDSENLMLKCNSSVQWVPLELDKFNKSPNSSGSSSPSSSIESTGSDISNGSIDPYTQHQWLQSHGLLPPPNVGQVKPRPSPGMNQMNPNMNPYNSPGTGITPKGSPQPLTPQHPMYGAPNSMFQPRTPVTASTIPSFPNNFNYPPNNYPNNYPPVSPRQMNPMLNTQPMMNNPMMNSPIPVQNPNMMIPVNPLIPNLQNMNIPQNSPGGGPKKRRPRPP